MRKNVASQIVGAQLNSKTDGSAVTTGTTTAYVLGDGGTQAAGSVGSGACAHEGNGFWTYAPAQAETNYDHVAFTFVNTSAVIASVQIYPSFPQTGDNFARLGAPVGASISADIAGVQADTDNVQTRLPAALVSGRIDASVGAMAANVITDAAINADAITDAKVAADVTIASVTGAVGSVTGAVGSVTGLTASDVGAIKTKTDFLPSATAGAAGGVFIAGSNAATTANITGNLTGNVSGSVGSVTGAVGSVTGAVGSVTGAVGSVASGGIAAASFAAGAINAAAIATDAIDADALAANAVTEIQSGLSTLSAAAAADAVWDELIAGHAVSGSTGEALSAAGTAGDPWLTALPGAYGAGTAGKIIGDNIDATISSRTKPADTQAAVTTVTNLTNAPTAGDLTATMKTSVTTAATAATPTVAGVSGVTFPASVASPTNITAGTITTVTNLTNAPTAGDLTATMKTSVTTAATAATPTAAAVTGAVGSVTGNVGGNVVGSVGSVTVVSDKTGYRLSSTGVDDILDDAVDGATTLRESSRLWNAALGGKASGLATTSAIYRDLADTKDRITATVDADGNRTTVVRDLT